MKLGLATKKDFRLFWSLNRAYQNYEEAYETDNMRLREQRALRVILGRLDKMGGSFIRVVHGCEILIAKVQDPSEDTYCLKPVYGAAPELLVSLVEALDAVKTFHGADCWDIYWDNAPEMKRARAAIANATGGAA
jgi:hypothetical protein